MHTCLGLARTLCTWCVCGIFGRETTRDTVTYGVYVRFWPTRFWPTLHMSHGQPISGCGQPNSGRGQPGSGQPCTYYMANPFLAVANLILVMSNPVLANPARITWPTHFWSWPTRFWPSLHVLMANPFLVVANLILVVANPVLANPVLANPTQVVLVVNFQDPAHSNTYTDSKTSCV